MMSGVKSATGAKGLTGLISRVALLLWLLNLLPHVAMAEERTSGSTPLVHLYVLPNCGYCERARQHLRARGIAFEEFNIAADADRLARFKALGGQGTPLLQVGERVLHGYVPEQLDAALAAAQ